MMLSTTRQDTLALTNSDRSADLEVLRLLERLTHSIYQEAIGPEQRKKRWSR